jgi:hypothetical protein
MDQKNLMALSAGPVNPTTTGELPASELAQLSEEALQLAQLSDEALLCVVGGGIADDLLAVGVYLFGAIPSIGEFIPKIDNPF